MVGDQLPSFQLCHSCSGRKPGRNRHRAAPASGLRPVGHKEAQDFTKTGCHSCDSLCFFAAKEICLETGGWGRQIPEVVSNSSLNQHNRRRSIARASSRKNVRDRAAVGDAVWAAGLVVNFGAWVEAESPWVVTEHSAGDVLKRLDPEPSSAADVWSQDARLRTLRIEVDRPQGQGHKALEETKE